MWVRPKATKYRNDPRRTAGRCGIDDIQPENLTFGDSDHPGFKLPDALRLTPRRADDLNYFHIIDLIADTESLLRRQTLSG